MKMKLSSNHRKVILIRMRMRIIDQLVVEVENQVMNWIKKHWVQMKRNKEVSHKK